MADLKTDGGGGGGIECQQGELTIFIYIFYYYCNDGSVVSYISPSLIFREP
jgi:hypothetical protein